MINILDKIKDYAKVMNEDVGDGIISEIEDMLIKITSKQLPKCISCELLESFHGYLLRKEYIKRVGFALLTEDFICNLSEYIGDKKCLEVLAGKGALSKSLQGKGVDIIPTDNYSWNDVLHMYDLWTDVEDIDCIEAIKKYGKDVEYIICSWIPYKDAIGTEILKAMNAINPNIKLIVIGEASSGCTADDSFFENIECIHSECMYTDDINGLQRWGGIYDHVKVVRLKNK